MRQNRTEAVGRCVAGHTDGQVGVEVREDCVRGHLLLDRLEGAFTVGCPLPALSSLKKGVQRMQSRCHVGNERAVVADQAQKTAQFSDGCWAWCFLDGINFGL